MQRNCKFVLIGFALLLLGFSCVFAFKWLQRSTLTSRVNSQTQIVGTWKNQQGNVFDFRRDGTLRNRWTGDKTNQIGYFRYRLVGDELHLDYSAKPDEYFRRLRQAVFGMNTERSRVATLSNDELGLVDRRSGETVMFERSHDAILNDAP